MTPTTLQLSDSGRQVAFRASGGGEPVMLLHGVGMQSAAWAPQIEALSATHHVIAVDLPGHGGSDPLPTGSALADFVKWTDQVVQALGLGPVNLVGHSMGALIAGGAACLNPELIRRVALLNGVYRRDAAARAAVTARAQAIAQGKIDLETPLARWFGDDPSEREIRAQVAGWLGSVDLVGYAVAYAAFAAGDATFADRFKDIRCPFLAMTGDGDPNSTPAMSQAMACAVAHGRAVVLPGQRHMVNLTAPEAVNKHLKGWLETPVVTGETP